VVAKVAPTPTPELQPKPAPKPVPKKQARPAQKTEPKPESKAESIAAPLPLPLAAKAAPAACAPASEIDRSTVCAALDYKNAQLREQIGALEGKVRVLQVAMGASPSAVDRSTPVGPVNAAKPHPVRHRPLPEPAAPTPWGTIGGAVAAVLALLGGGLLLVQRRKRAGRIQPMPALPLTARLKQRFARKNRVNKAANNAENEALEPQLDEAAHETSTQL
jgi:pilus assembly protein FimV